MRYFLTLVIWAALIASFLFWYHRRSRQRSKFEREKPCIHCGWFYGHHSDWCPEITVCFETKVLEEYESRNGK